MERDEEIIKASAAIFKENGDEFASVVQLFWISAFLAGAKWADEHPVNVWHDASEEPERRNGGILCEHDLYYWVATQPYLSSIYGNWHKKVKREHLVRWAYISDLLPKGGEE